MNYLEFEKPIEELQTQLEKIQENLYHTRLFY